MLQIYVSRLHNNDVILFKTESKIRNEMLGALRLTLFCAPFRPHRARSHVDKKDERNKQRRVETIEW